MAYAAATMSSEENPRRHRWPFFALAAVVLAVVLAVAWMRVAVKKIEAQRDDYAPLPASAPTR